MLLKKREGKEGKVGITAGEFDLLHAGHLIMFEEYKNYCDHLIVCLHTNPNIDRKEKRIPIQTTFERYVQLSSVKFIDEIIVYDTERDLENILQIIDYDVRFVGEDWKNKKFTGMNIKSEKTMFNERKHNYSSTFFVNKISRRLMEQESE